MELDSADICVCICLSFVLCVIHMCFCVNFHRSAETSSNKGSRLSSAYEIPAPKTRTTEEIKKKYRGEDAGGAVTAATSK